MNFISTGLLNFKKTSSIIKKIYEHNIQNIELSSGKYEKNLEKFLYKFKKENKQLNSKIKESDNIRESFSFQNLIIIYFS